jgi:hypothetical protein
MTGVTPIELTNGWNLAPAVAEGEQVSVKHFDTSDGLNVTLPSTVLSADAVAGERGNHQSNVFSRDGRDAMIEDWLRFAYVVARLTTADGKLKGRRLTLNYARIHRSLN